MEQRSGQEREDARLCARAQAGDVGAANLLIRTHLPLVRHLVSRCGSESVESEDLLQEGLIGLFQAVLAYDGARGAAFSTFAYRCVRNRLLSALSEAADPPPAFPGREEAASQGDPQEILQSRENLQALSARARECLSKREREVLRLYLEGLTYREIAGALETTEKSVDNAMQRVRRKLRGASNG